MFIYKMSGWKWPQQNECQQYGHSAVVYRPQSVDLIAVMSF